MENYFNYFTEIEEQFRRCRSAHTSSHPRLLLSPLDWALMESWKDAGIPLEAVLAGIERTFENWQKRPRRFQKINSLGFCSQEVMKATEKARTAGRQAQRPAGNNETAAPFSSVDILDFLRRNALAIEQASMLAAEKSQRGLRDDLAAVLDTIRQIAARMPGQDPDLEHLERHLSVLEEKLVAALIHGSSPELLVDFQAEVDRGISQYRGKMMPAQIDSLQRQFLKKRLFEHYAIPRLSLFYL